MIGVYRIKNIVNNKIYIGSSKDIEKRWKRHRYELKNNKHHSPTLQRDWNEYGKDNFIFSILETTNNILELLDLEQQYIDNLLPVYNISIYAKQHNKRYLKYVENENGYLLGYSAFYMGNIDEIQAWMNDLTTIEKAFIFSIVPYISYEDCCLKYSNNKDLGTEDLVKVSGLSRGSVYEVIDGLVKKDILYKGENSKTKQYFMNPWLFCKGQRLNKVLKTMFKNYKIRVLGNKKWSDI